MRQPDQRRRTDGFRGSAGFTLVELIIVLVILLVLISWAMPRINLGRIRVDTSSMRVASFLLMAQRTAVMKQHDVRISFDEAASSLRIHDDANNNGLVDTGERNRVEPLGEGILFGLTGAALTGTGVPLTFRLDSEGLPTVIYRRNGSASEEGAAHISALPVGQAENDRAIFVTRATGLARCWSRASGTWNEGC